MSEEWQPESPDLDALDEHLKKIEQVSGRARDFFKEMTEEKEKRKATGEDFNSFLDEPGYRTRCWRKEEMIFYVTQHPEYKHFCGYVRFPKRPVMEPGLRGIITYVPVHGGVSWAEDSPDGSFVYGFDCMHASDTPEDHYAPGAFEARMAKFNETHDPADLMPKPIPRTDEWLYKECETMGRAIKACAQYEGAYLATDGDTQARATVLDNLHKYMRAEDIGHFHLSDNTTAIINLLSGSL